MFTDTLSPHLVPVHTNLLHYKVISQGKGYLQKLPPFSIIHQTGTPKTQVDK